MTAVGVRRCTNTCDPDGGAPCPGACLPDREDPDLYICWLGGLTPYREACTSSYECARGMGCGRDGTCGYLCATEGAPCRPEGHVCRDFVCTPEGP